MGALKLGVDPSASQSAIASNDRMAVYDRYGSIAYGIILQIISQDELAQQVLVDLFASPEIDTWSQSGSMNTCHLIRLARVKALEAKATLLTSSLPDSIKISDDLSPKRIFDLSFYQGYKPETIAEQLNVSHTTILKSIRDYFQYLRTSLS